MNWGMRPSSPELIGDASLGRLFEPISLLFLGPSLLKNLLSLVISGGDHTKLEPWWLREGCLSDHTVQCHILGTDVHIPSRFDKE